MPLWTPPSSIQPALAVQPPGGTHDCYFEVLDANNIRLTRFGGNQLMIAGKRETIPSSLLLTPWGVAAQTYWHIYAYMNAGAMLFYASPPSEGAPVVDANGMLVHPTNAALTFVGMVQGGAATFYAPSQIATVGAISYYNRKRRAVRQVTSQTTTSGSAVHLSNFYCMFLSFGDDTARLMASGALINNTAGQTAFVQHYAGNAGLAAVSQINANTVAVAGQQQSMGLAHDLVAPAAGAWAASLYAWVTGGTGNFFATNSVAFEG